VSTATGWTFEHIDEMGMDRMVEFLDYLSANPPAHLILKAIHFGDATPPAATADDEVADLGAIASEVGASGGTPSPVPPWLRKIADEATAIKKKAH
jgi:hypothetical protein